MKIYLSFIYAFVGGPQILKDALHLKYVQISHSYDKEILKTMAYMNSRFGGNFNIQIRVLLFKYIHWINNSHSLIYKIE